MKTIIEYIKESQNSVVNFNDFVNAVEEEIENAGFEIVKYGPKGGQASVIKDKNFATFTLIFGKKEGKSKFDTGAYIGMELDVTKQKDNPFVYLKMSYSNGKRSYSVNSTANRSMRFELNFGEVVGHSLMKKAFGGHEYYECNPDTANKILNGIKMLKYDKTTYEEAIGKSRFTETAWKKLIATTEDRFSSSGSSMSYRNRPWND